MILAEALDIPVSKVTVKNAPYVGGGFGVRIGLSGKAEILAAALSMQCFRPVKLIYTREEDFTCSDSRHGGYLKCKLGAKADGTFVAIDTQAWLNTGAAPAAPPGPTPSPTSAIPAGRCTPTR